LNSSLSKELKFELQPFTLPQQDPSDFAQSDFCKPIALNEPNSVSVFKEIEYAQKVFFFQLTFSIVRLAKSDLKPSYEEAKFVKSLNYAEYH